MHLKTGNNSRSTWTPLTIGLALLLAPGTSQVLFTYAVRDAGPSRASATVGMAPLFAVTFAAVILDEPLASTEIVSLFLDGVRRATPDPSGRNDHRC